MLIFKINLLVIGHSMKMIISISQNLNISASLQYKAKTEWTQFDSLIQIHWISNQCFSIVLESVYRCVVYYSTIVKRRKKIMEKADLQGITFYYTDKYHNFSNYRNTWGSMGSKCNRDIYIYFFLHWRVQKRIPASSSFQITLNHK